MADPHTSVIINSENIGHSAAAAAGGNSAKSKQETIHPGQPPPFGQPTPIGQPPPNEDGHTPDKDRKINLAHDTLPEDVGWQQQGTKKSRRDGARSPMDTQGDIYNGPEVGQTIPIKFKFTGPAIEKN